jgi:uncharacterized membrane protein YciS (DUF1049 family)
MISVFFEAVLNISTVLVCSLFSLVLYLENVDLRKQIKEILAQQEKDWNGFNDSDES